MIVLQWCKTQIMCLLILAYVGVGFIRDGNSLLKLSKKSSCNPIYDTLFIVSELALLFDGITACTVNYPEQVPKTLNLLLHFGMYFFYELYALLLFLYWTSVTVGITKNKWKKAVYF